MSALAALLMMMSMPPKRSTVASTNVQLTRVDTITTAAASVSENVSALTSLFAATVGGPMVKVAAFSYAVRRAFGGLTGQGRSPR